MEIFKKSILWIWQLPQNILGICFFGILKISKAINESYPYKDTKVYYYNNSFLSGVSLGNYIFIRGKLTNFSKHYTVLHEYGHHIQSMRWGIFYLFIIGIPSVINNLWDRFFHKKWSYSDRYIWYYSRYPEKQADILGNVPKRW